MINNSPDNYEKFPVPVTGTPIPRGWFGRLVAFVNSLVLHGDKQYFAVEHGPNGTTIAPTTALINALSAGSGAPPASGSGASGLEAVVSGGTATVSVSGSDPLVIEPANANIQIFGGTAGKLLIGASAMIGTPDYFYASPEFVYVDASAVKLVPSQTSAMWLIGTVGVNTASNMSGSVQFSMSTFQLTLFDLTIGTGSLLSGLAVPVSLYIPAGHAFQLTASGSAFGNFNLYPSI